MTGQSETFGRTIQLFLVDGVPGGLVVASIKGWTGSVLVGTQSTFARLLARPEVDRTGLYILHGPDPEDSLGTRAYIGEADSVRERIETSADRHDFWEVAVVITTSDEALTKGDVRYLEARLIDIASTAGRVALANSQAPQADRRRLPEADKANMEAFLANLRVILPMVGLDLLKPKPRAASSASSQAGTETRFEIQHKSGIAASAVEEDGEFIVLAGSQSLKDTGYQWNSYGELKRELIEKGILAKDDTRYVFSRSYSFRSPSAAAAVVLDRNANGRKEWRIAGTRRTYHDWQQEAAQPAQVTR